MTASEAEEVAILAEEKRRAVVEVAMAQEGLNQAEMKKLREDLYKVEWSDVGKVARAVAVGAALGVQSGAAVAKLGRGLEQVLNEEGQPAEEEGQPKEDVESRSSFTQQQQRKVSTAEHAPWFSFGTTSKETPSQEIKVQAPTADNSAVEKAMDKVQKQEKEIDACTAVDTVGEMKAALDKMLKSHQGASLMTLQSYRNPFPKIHPKEGDKTRPLPKGSGEGKTTEGPQNGFICLDALHDYHPANEVLFSVLVRDMGLCDETLYDKAMGGSNTDLYTQTAKDMLANNKGRKALSSMVDSTVSAATKLATLTGVDKLAGKLARKIGMTEEEDPDPFENCPEQAGGPVASSEGDPEREASCRYNKLEKDEFDRRNMEAEAERPGTRNLCCFRDLATLHKIMQ